MRHSNKRLPSMSTLVLEERPTKLLTSPSAGAVGKGGAEREPFQFAQVSSNGKRVFMSAPFIEEKDDEQEHEDVVVDLTQELEQEGFVESEQLERDLEMLLQQNRSHIAVCVSGFGTVEDLGKQYTAFEIRVSVKSNELKKSGNDKNGKDTSTHDMKEWTVYRRYSAFGKLVRLLHKVSSSFVKLTPSLPCKLASKDKDNKQALLQRAEGLHNWLTDLILLWKTSPQVVGENGVRQVLATFLSQECRESGSVQAYVQGTYVATKLSSYCCPIFLEESQNLNPNMSPRTATTTLVVRRQDHQASCLSDFDLVKVVGKGSFGQVFLARQLSNKATVQRTSQTTVDNSKGEQVEDSTFVAIKVLHKAEMVRRKQSGRVEVERKCMELADCPFIVALHGAFATEEHLFLAQDFCAGGEMYFHLDIHGKFSAKLARFYAAECAIALAHLHEKGIVYRDLKPENIMISHDGHIKLVDFGLAKIGVEHATHGALSFVGTMEYLSPEMIAKKGHGFAVDYWSLGMVLYEMLTGLPPWYSEDRKSVLNHIQNSELTFPTGQVSMSARSILRGLLQKDPKQRLGTAGGLVQLQSHSYFSSIDFNKLAEKKIKPPFVPTLAHPSDTSYFDKLFTGLHVAVDFKAGDVLQDSALIRKAQRDGLFDGFKSVAFPANFERHSSNESMNQ